MQRKELMTGEELNTIRKRWDMSHEKMAETLGCFITTNKPHGMRRYYNWINSVTTVPGHVINFIRYFDQFFKQEIKSISGSELNERIESFRQQERDKVKQASLNAKRK